MKKNIILKNGSQPPGYRKGVAEGSLMGVLSGNVWMRLLES